MNTHTVKPRDAAGAECELRIEAPALRTAVRNTKAPLHRFKHAKVCSTPSSKGEQAPCGAGVRSNFH